MGDFDVMFDAQTQGAIKKKMRLIRKRVDREDFYAEAMQELWSSMSFERSEITAIINNVFRRFEG